MTEDVKKKQKKKLMTKLKQQKMRKVCKAAQILRKKRNFKGQHYSLRRSTSGTRHVTIGVPALPLQGQQADPGIVRCTKRKVSINWDKKNTPKNPKKRWD